MKIYNTLTRQKEELQPLNKDYVGIYSCGPTVYQYAHIGNLRTYIFMDELRRVLKRNGYTLKHVMNITDVGHLTSDGDEGEDKMEKSARIMKKDPYEIAAYFTDVFLKDIDRLNITRPEIITKATDNINQMIDFVVGLCDKGYGYETSDGIYYDIQKFKGYGKLSGNNLDDLMSGARVDVNDEKRHPADFAIWKKAPKEHIMQWESPWGMGYPGWHIECSAMGLRFLGEKFDIHTGGVDHIPIHHENEIAQSEGLLGHPMVNYWMHGEFMLVNGGKMSKSLGNTYTIDQLIEKGYSPLVFRYFCLNAHYRNKINFTFESMDAAKKALKNLHKEIDRHKGADGKVDAAVIENFRNEFNEAVNDDLNIPKALGIVWNMAKYETKSNDIYELILSTDDVLGLDLDKEFEDVEVAVDDDLSNKVEELIAKRLEAKKAKDWATADAIRNELTEMGIALKDTPQGTTWSKM